MSHDKKASRFWLYAPLILFALLFAAYSAFWFYMRGELDKGIDDWISEQRATGADVRFSAKKLGGYPYRFALTVDDPVYADPAQGLRWRGEQLQLVMQPWNWNHVIGRSVGANEIETPEGVFDIQLGRKSVGSISWDETSIRRISITLDEADLQLDDKPLGKVAGFEFHLRPAEDNPDTLQLVTQWQSIRFDQPLVPSAAMLGDDVQASRMLVELTDAFPTMTSPAGLSGWDGRVRIAQFLLNWGPAKLGLKGDFGLDACGVPDTGNIDLRLDDVPALRSAMHEARMLDMKTGAALSFLEDASKDGGFASIGFRDGGMYMGFIRLGDLPQGC